MIMGNTLMKSWFNQRDYRYDLPVGEMALFIYYTSIMIRNLENYLPTYIKKQRLTFTSLGWYLILLDTDLWFYRDLKKKKKVF